MLVDNDFHFYLRVNISLRNIGGKKKSNIASAIFIARGTHKI